ncbi:MAG: hypothetical protein FJY73_08715 [Candidatus Eisenbacteria bacterium]|nr:hypothetical protein [Candidatus Eisenbacteria bacterium]
MNRTPIPDRRARAAPAPRAGLLVLSLLLSASVVFASLPLREIPEGAYRPGDTGDALLLVRVGSIDDLWEFVEAWEAAGARFPHVYPPNLLIGDVPESIERKIRADERLIELHRKPAAVSVGKTTSEQRLLVDSWNRELVQEPPEPSKMPVEFGDLLLGPAWIPPEDASPGKHEGGLVRMYGSAFGATMIQSSELLLGKVAVAIVLPDGPGTTYSDTEISVVYAKARGAMDFFSANVEYPGVRFVYDLRRRVPTSHNFQTTPPHLHQKEWVEEVMDALGYDLYVKGTDFGPVYQYLDSLRIRMRCEWGACLFIPKVSYFAGAGYTAYAYLGGPFLVVPSGINGKVTPHGSGSMDLSHLIIHEFAHLFWALDEYPAGGTSSPCHATSGYLAIRNRNSLNWDYTCERHVACCMDVPAPFICRFTLGQMGIWDSEDPPDGIPDVLDTHPFVYADTLPDTVVVIDPLIHGIAAEIPVVNRAYGGGSGAGKGAEVAGARPDITFNSIEHVIYRIDEMADEEGNPIWFYADPEGGWGGDSTRVHFAFRPYGLTGGPHTIRIKAVNTVGNVSTWGENRQGIFVKAIALRDFAAAPDYDGRVRVSYKIEGIAFGASATLYRRAEGGTDERIFTHTLADDSEMVLFDEHPRPGERYHYRLEARALGASWEWEADVISPARIAPGEHVSQITPNPFRSSTMISIKVPRGDPTHRLGGGGGKPGPNPPNPYNPNTGAAPQLEAGSQSRYKIVRVEIDIFDVAGRLVRSFPPIHSYEGFYSEPYVWDGTDDSGRRVPQGVYFARMKAGDHVEETRKIVFIR